MIPIKGCFLPASVVYPGDYALMEESSVQLRTLAE
nr:MAG TPA: hypothetical protein [Caudoviricetes sp.]